MRILEVDDFGFDINVAYKSVDDDFVITNVYIINQTKEIDVFDFISDESYERLLQKIIDFEGGFGGIRQREDFEK